MKGPTPGVKASDAPTARVERARVVARRNAASALDPKITPRASEVPGRAKTIATTKAAASTAARRAGMADAAPSTARTYGPGRDLKDTRPTGVRAPVAGRSGVRRASAALLARGASGKSPRKAFAFIPLRPRRVRVVDHRVPEAPPAPLGGERPRPEVGPP